MIGTCAILRIADNQPVASYAFSPSGVK